MRQSDSDRRRDDITNRIGLAQQPQRQDSLTAQVEDVMRLAVFFGCYDAHDWMRQQWRGEVLGRAMNGELT